MNGDDFDALIGDLCVHATLTRVPGDAGCALLLDERQHALVITLDRVDDDVLLLAPLDADVTLVGREQLIQLLRLAYLGQGLGGAAVGLDEASGTLVLWQRVPAVAADIQRLRAIVDRFAEARVAFD
jgi:hypothetical protein